MRIEYSLQGITFKVYFKCPYNSGAHATLISLLNELGDMNWEVQH